MARRRVQSPDWDARAGTGAAAAETVSSARTELWNRRREDLKSQS